MHDVDFDQLKARAASRRRIKTNLVAHQESIKKMMDADISLPLIFDWLAENGVDTALTTLRRFVKRTYGEAFYSDFSRRNGWQKDKREDKGKPSPSRPTGAGLPASTTLPGRQVKQGVESQPLEDPSDINNFFNRRKT